MGALHDFKAELFKALGHPLRLRILELLRTGEKTVGELQRLLMVEASSVSQQLAVMRAHHLVESRKQGTNVFYSVKDPLIFDLMDTARTIFENQLATWVSVLDEPES
ncbi:transcriptional regulator, ArsR family [Sulfobacillus acidophilus TPY]|uniref:Transcriptional regulator, ArsR family n=1 Tax=Sulfobacillus acidophilus (strain ATCC 700253 / DSM 10332 / NAL) TaxID=679936 RepID=G8U0G1_SULAD|nr:transcriptional regulator, ArsR family [Sulfobacillus acidophilus TPY]AEW06503.1 transcriptional regulator, ArsR family [Sulfobacillus acidophilus DSM 10332]